MGKFIRLYLIICLALISLVAHSQTCAKWVFGYVPTYQQSQNGDIDFLETSDFTKLSFIGHLGPYVKSDGSLDMNINGTSTLRLMGGVAQAHANNVPILLSFQAWYTDYLPAIQNPTSRANLLNNILNIFDTYGYDGIDVDLEPIMSQFVTEIQTGNPDYIVFINTLYDSLQTRNSSFLNKKPILSVAANGYAAPVLKTLETKFDMINIMTYDLAGPYPGWVTWHDAPVFSGGFILPSTGQPMPSVDGEIQICLSNNINNTKLGIGASFDALRWKGGSGTTTGGVTEPMQQYATDPSWTRFSYSYFYQNIYNPTLYHYDNLAKMSYLSIDNPGSNDDEFWSYNDENSCKDKIKYVWNNQLGGIILWELKSGYIPTNPSLSRIPQLNYIAEENNTQFQIMCNNPCGTTTISKN